MNRNLNAPTQGTCPRCRKTVQLIYPGGQTLGSLVIGPHHGPVTREAVIAGKVDKCPGVGQLPIEAKKAAAQK